MSTRVFGSLTAVTLLGGCGYLVAASAGWFGGATPSRQATLLSGSVAAAIGTVVLVAGAGLGALAARDGRARALRSEERRLRLERQQRRTQALCGRRQVAYGEALALTAPLDGEENPELPDLKAHLIAVELGLRGWQHHRAGPLLSEQAHQSCLALCHWLQAATSHEGPPTPRELEAVWRAKTEFRKSLRADERGQPVAELHTFPAVAVPLQSRTAGRKGAGRAGRGERGRRRVGPTEIVEVGTGNRPVRDQPGTATGRWGSPVRRKSPAGSR